MKTSYVTAIIVPTISISLSVLTLLTTILIYWNFHKDLSEVINVTLREDESILLTVVNQPELQINDLYLSYTLKAMSFSLFYEDKKQIHPKKTIDNEVFKLLKLNTDDKRFYILNKINSRRILNIVTRIEINNQNITIISQKNLSYLYTSLLENIAIGVLLLLLGSLILVSLLYKISLKLTISLKRLMSSAERISKGYYNERVIPGGLREIDEVGSAFNKMALDIEEKIDTLQIENDKKELFISGFTHELKTPLTNIIGYSDHLIR